MAEPSEWARREAWRLLQEEACVHAKANFHCSACLDFLAAIAIALVAARAGEAKLRERLEREAERQESLLRAADSQAGRSAMAVVHREIAIVLRDLLKEAGDA